MPPPLIVVEVVNPNQERRDYHHKRTDVPGFEFDGGNRSQFRMLIRLPYHPITGDSAPAHITGCCQSE